MMSSARPASDLDLLPTQVAQDLRSTVRDLLASRCSPASVLTVYDEDRALGAGLWKAISVELGLAGLLVPAERGGHGGSAREAAVVLEELGRFMAPVPFMTSSVIATTLLTDLACDPRLVGSIASGECTAALVVPWSNGPDAQISTMCVDDNLVIGTITSVAGAIEADLLLVPVAMGDTISICVVSAGDALVEPVVSFDMSRQLADVTLRRAPVVAMIDDGEEALRGALSVGAGLLASEQVGVARWCLETTVEYLKVRRQFGRTLGSFQALKHRLADLYTAVESADAAATYAASALAVDDPDASIAVAVAQAYCSEAAVLAAEEAVQLHAGIGMTWEHPVHLYLKRAMADHIGLGTPGAHRTALADHVGLPLAVGTDRGALVDVR